MAHWISSKLKAAETLLHQIDQQAAESLGKSEKPRSDEQLGLETSPTVGETRSLIKEQLKKKVPENVSEKNNLKVISRSDSNIKRDDDVGVSVNLNSKSNSKSSSRSGLTDSDWTELLSVPKKNVASGGVSGSQSSTGAMGIRGLKKDGTKHGRLGSKALEGKRTENGQSNGVLKGSRKSNVELESSGGSSDSGRASDVGGVMPRTSISELQSDRGESDRKDTGDALVPDNKYEEVTGKIVEANGIGDGEKLHSTDGLTNYDLPMEIVPASLDRKLNMKFQMKEDERIKSGTLKNNKLKVGSRSSSSIKKGSSPSDEESDSETDSTSSSDSEIERERAERIKRRQQILAERAAAKAFEAIKDRENLVAKLEGEKQSLEKIFEERAKQQVQEASELQTSMMEIMEAADLEKQKHNNTRMEALVRLSKLETVNADLARCLAAAQKNLEVEVDRIAELRQKIQLKEGTHEELRRKISVTLQNGETLVASKGVEFELKMLEAEYSFITDKVERLQEKAKTLETNIGTTQREIENPTEVEIQLKQRLDQFTDHLIQKQAQVEALSSEKAMLLFRIEGISRLLDENKSIMELADFPGTSSRDDLESGVWEPYDLKFSPSFKQKIRSGQQHLGSLIRQLDSIFSSSVVVLRRNSTARIWSVVYFLCLHLWVLYILTSHSPVSDDSRSGAVVSLQNINNTGSV